jgi:imidazole glycerol phosphate synthase glutamine amidotransferase subunit
MIAIIDYGAGNVHSVKNALAYLEVDCKITSSAADILAAKRIVLPGVGSFEGIMRGLKKYRLVDPIKQSISSGRPFLGICLGLQALFSSSEESPGVRGLGIFSGTVRKFGAGKVPQIGWNSIVPCKDGIFREGYVYFVNSYYVNPDNDSIVAATTDYFGSFASALQCGNITACQFHPEKSGDVGLGILKRWLKC